MVKLTLDMMLRNSSGKKRKEKEEQVSHFLSRLTHLYLEGKDIDETEDEFTRCGNLSCLYLYDNLLPNIPNLKKNENLTQLYLHNNNITNVNNLENLRYLEKLFIGYNKLIVLEGLENCSSLKELHIENQKLEEGEFLVFDPRTIAAISATLQVLNISGNGLESLDSFMDCINLNDLRAHTNQISNMADTINCLINKTSLVKLDLSQNPISSQPKYRDKIIVACNNLENLDGKDITAVSRKFLVNWQNSKDMMELKSLNKNISNNNIGNIVSSESFYPEACEANSANEIRFNSSSYLLPGFPASNKKKSTKMSQIITKSEPLNYNAQSVNHNLNGFSINGNSSMDQ